jgi:ABC-type multidrug transport system fused ATPase/permease subunit
MAYGVGAPEFSTQSPLLIVQIQRVRFQRRVSRRTDLNSRQQDRTASSPHSRSRASTPSSTRCTPEGQRFTTPYSVFDDHAESGRVSPSPDNMASKTHRFSPFVLGEKRIRSPETAFDGVDDPDTPLPSVESDTSSTTIRPNISGRFQSMPSDISDADMIQPALEQDTILQEIGHIERLRLTSPQSPHSSTLSRNLSTPSIQVTPLGSSGPADHPRASRADSLVTGVSALHLGPSEQNPSEIVRPRESRSPSVASQCRSGSAVAREIHKVELEGSPETFANMAEVQEALANARTVASRISDVLGSSNLHRENGSSIQRLYQQAKNLEDFQLPPSRIVGLVGDSGMGKSSLINSLLDKAGLARAVSDSAVPIPNS